MTENDYAFIIETTNGGLYIHGDLDPMDIDSAVQTVEVVSRLVNQGDVLHVRRVESARPGALPTAIKGALDHAPWTAHQFNPLHVVSVFAIAV